MTDFTYCSAKDCDKADKCLRNIKHAPKNETISVIEECSEASLFIGGDNED